MQLVDIEKSTFFLKLEKKPHRVQNQICKLIFDWKEIVNSKEIAQKIYSYYESLFKKHSSKSELDNQQFFDNVTASILSNDQINLCDKELSKEYFYKAMKSMSNNKSPGNDGLTKEFYLTFWDDLKEAYMMSVKQAFHKKALSTSQRQPRIRLIEKKIGINGM